MYIVLEGYQTNMMFDSAYANQLIREENVDIKKIYLLCFVKKKDLCVIKLSKRKVTLPSNQNPSG